MDDEIAHMGIVNRGMGLGVPCLIGFFIIRVKAYEIHIVKIGKLNSVERGHLAADNHMKQLFFHNPVSIA